MCSLVCLTLRSRTRPSSHLCMTSGSTQTEKLHAEVATTQARRRRLSASPRGRSSPWFVTSAATSGRRCSWIGGRSKRRRRRRAKPDSGGGGAAPVAVRTRALKRSVQHVAKQQANSGIGRVMPGRPTARSTAVVFYPYKGLLLDPHIVPKEKPGSRPFCLGIPECSVIQPGRCQVGDPKLPRSCPFLPQAKEDAQNAYIDRVVGCPASWVETGDVDARHRRRSVRSGRREVGETLLSIAYSGWRKSLSIRGEFIAVIAVVRSDA